MAFPDGNADCKKLSAARPPIRPQVADDGVPQALHDTTEDASGSDY